MQRMLDVFHGAQLAKPAPRAQLAGRMLRLAGQGEQGDLLETGFELVMVADHVAERCQRIPEGFYRFGSGCASGPGIFLGEVRPPPVTIVSGCAGNAVVVAVLRARNLKGLVPESGKDVLETRLY